MDELGLAAAAFFRNRGKNVVTEREFIMVISFDLKWMAPTDTEILLSALLDRGHLKREGEYLRPAFDVHAADVPLGFKPSSDIVKNLKKKRTADGDLLSELMSKAESSGIRKKDLIVSSNAVQKRLNVDIEVAALLVLREKGIDVSCYSETVYELISKR